MPVHRLASRAARAAGRRRSAADHLHRARGAHVARRDEALLVERADRDAEQRDAAPSPGSQASPRRRACARRRAPGRRSRAPARATAAPTPSARAARRRVARQPERGQHRLQADQQRHRAGADARLHRRPDAAEVAGLHQHAGDGEVHHCARPARPGGARERDPDDEAGRRQGDSAASGSRTAARAACQPRDDEAGAPDQDEDPRHRAQRCTRGDAPRRAARSCVSATRARISGSAFCR